MSQWWQRWLTSLTPGVRRLLFFLTAVYTASLIGGITQAFDLHTWLVLSGPKFWSGQIWRLVSYMLLPAGILDFVMNSFALYLLGGMLERHWSRVQLWTYCILTSAGAGLAKVVLQHSNPQPLTGATPMMFGLLIALGLLSGRESIMMVPFGEMTVWKLVLAAGGVSFLMVLLTAGLSTAIIMAAGGLTGWLYLWIKHKWLMNRAGSVVHSERINRLEL
jgi:membrane associated rhomboid family serine protease